LNIKPGNIIKCQRKFKLVDPYCTKNVLQIYLQKEEGEWNGWLYLAPEIKNYSCLLEGLDFSQADIYSLGMCVIENLLGERYFPREGRALRSYLQKYLNGYSPSLVRTLMGMVSSDPRKRPQAE
jgi:serine/threonine protein kinase